MHEDGDYFGVRSVFHWSTDAELSASEISIHAFLKSPRALCVPSVS